jgi:catechol 2,3-dioxygenase-like lactoylglutathione lyase family enzyme
MTTSTPAPGPTGSVASYAFWGRDGRALADFYAAALGGQLAQEFPDEAGTPTAFLVTAGGATYVFYTAKEFKAPNWPAEELPFHLDLSFDDPAAAEKRLIALGATRPDHQPGGEQWTVLLDPSGQPFCLSGTWTG